MKRFVPITSIVLGIGFFLLLSGPLGLIEWHYPRRIDNDPLFAPVKVVNIQGNIISLEDGRRFTVTSFNGSLESPTLTQAIKASNGEVDVVTDGVNVDIFVRNERWICGTGRNRGLIRIPLIPREEHRNDRNSIGEVAHIRMK